MERNKQAEQYFHQKINSLVDEVYSTSEKDVAALFVEIHGLRGALSYALALEDIDSGYNRVFSDMLAGIAGELFKE